MKKTMTKQQKRHLRNYTDTELISQLLKVRVVGRLENEEKEGQFSQGIINDTNLALQYEKEAQVARNSYQMAYGTFNQDMDMWANSDFKVGKEEQRKIIGEALGEFITIDEYVKKYGPKGLMAEVEQQWEKAKAKAN